MYVFWAFFFSILGNKLKEGWSKFVHKIKLKKAKKKKMKKMEQERLLKITAYRGDLSSDDNVSSREGSIRSQEEEDSDGVRLLHIMQCYKMKTIICQTEQIHYCFWPYEIRKMVIWRTTWQPFRRTWSNSSCHMRCGALAVGLSASRMWVINISDSVESPGGLLSVCRGLVIASTMSLGDMLKFWAGFFFFLTVVYYIVGWLGGWEANLHCSPGGKRQSWEPPMGHQEELHGYCTLQQQMAGKRTNESSVLLYLCSQFSPLNWFVDFWFAQLYCKVQDATILQRKPQKSKVLVHTDTMASHSSCG